VTGSNVGLNGSSDHISSTNDRHNLLHISEFRHANCDIAELIYADRHIDVINKRVLKLHIVCREFNRANHTRSLIGSSQCSSTTCWARAIMSRVLID